MEPSYKGNGGSGEEERNKNESNHQTQSIKELKAK